MEIGDRIRILREERGWSMYQLAKKSGVCASSICHYEQGETVPHLDKAVLVAQALGTTVEALMGAPEYCPTKQVLELKRDNVRLRKDLKRYRQLLQDLMGDMMEEILK